MRVALFGGSRVALFGGSFDPPHRAHLAIARSAADAFELETVLFAPTGRQPLKPGGATASFEHRLAMVTLACALDPRFAVSNIDAPKPNGDSNYTIDSLVTLRRLMPRARPYVLVGADSFLDLPRWHQPHRLLREAEWIVVSRPGSSIPDLSALSLSREESARVHLLETVHEDISATDLRRRLAAGDPCKGLIPEQVRAYIQASHLYQNT